MASDQILSEIHVKLGAIDAKLESRIGCLEKTVYGTPDENAPGLVRKVDRIEQAEKRRVWAIRSVLAASFTAVGGWLWQFFVSMTQHKP